MFVVDELNVSPHLETAIVVLAEAIRKCCEDKEYAAEVGKKCQERAMMYDISVMAEGYGQLYRTEVNS